MLAAALPDRTLGRRRASAGRGRHVSQPVGHATPVRRQRAAVPL